VARAKPKISKPGEHGGLVVVAASGIAAGVLAPAPHMAVVAAIAGVAAYMARGPVERRVRGFRRREWDTMATAAYGLAVVAAVAAVATRDVVAGALVGGGAIALVAVGAAVTAARKHRVLVVELVALAGCGALAGVFLFAGGGSERAAITIGAAMAAYGAATVPFVRAEVRELAAWDARAMAWLAVLLLLCGAAGVVVVAADVVAIAFAPRAAHCVARGVLGRPRSRRVLFVAVRETAEIAVFVTLVCVLI
jgi:hypothetical protein